MHTIRPGLYRHYKGKMYEVLYTARHSETEEPMVVYKATYLPEGQNIWVRPLSMFFENVNMNGVPVPRFEKIA
jgi:hypothetical protein